MQPPSPITPLLNCRTVRLSEFGLPRLAGGGVVGVGCVRAARILTFAAFFCLRLSPSFPSSFNTSYLFFLQNSLSAQVCSHLPLSAASVVHSAPCCLPLSLSERGSKKKERKKKRKKEAQNYPEPKVCYLKDRGIELEICLLLP